MAQAALHRGVDQERELLDFVLQIGGTSRRRGGRSADCSWSSTPRGSGRWWGNLLFGGFVSGFVGALVMIPAAYIVAGLPAGPPATVTFLPAFWLLVPGSLGLIGVTEIASGGPAGTDTLVGALGSIVAIALGVLCGVVLYQNVRTAPGRLRRLRSG